MIYVWSAHDFLIMDMFTQHGFVYEEMWCQSPQNWSFFVGFLFFVLEVMGNSEFRWTAKKNKAIVN